MNSKSYLRSITPIILAYLCLISTFVQAQTTRLGGSYFTTGGNYSDPNNTVKMLYWRPGQSQPTLIDEAAGNFSNFCEVNGRVILWHCGRAAGNGAGADVIYRIDPVEQKRMDSITKVPGAYRAISDGATVGVIFGYGANDSFFRLYELENLAKGATYADRDIPSGVGAIKYFNGRYYVAYTRNDSGFIATYNFFGSQLMDKTIYRLGPNGAGVKDIYPAGNRIYAIVEKQDVWPNPPLNAGVLEFTPQTGAVNFRKTPSAGASAGLQDNKIYGDFGNQLASFAILTMSIDKEPWANVTPSALAIDRLSGNVFAQETDYFSKGELKFFNNQGALQQTLTTDFSGAAISLLYNSPPVAVSFNKVTGVDVPVLLALGDSVIDYDGDKVFFSFKTGYPGTLQDNGTGYFTYTPPAGYRGTVTLDYNARDAFGDSTSARVTINVGNASTGTFDITAVKLYPVPAHGLVNLEMENESGIWPDIEVWDIGGRRLPVPVEQIGKRSYRLNLERLPAGFYQVKVTDNANTGVWPLIIK